MDPSSQLLQHLCNSIERFSNDTHYRLDRIESVLVTLSQITSSSQQNSILPSISSNESEFVKRPNLHLKVSEVPKKWYTRRTIPEIEVLVIDSDTGEIFTETKAWQFGVRLISGHQVYVDHFLGNPPLLFEVVDGKAQLFGFKIHAVSSRNGGHFRFEISANIPETNPLHGAKIQVLTNDFQILSERVITDRKAESTLDLSSSDCLSRIPGIGKKYALKFNEQGLKTIKDLAFIDSSPAGKVQRADLLASIRKDRGALTEAKFSELLRDAQAIVQKEEENLEQEQEHEHEQQEQQQEKEKEETVPVRSQKSNKRQLSELLKQEKEEEEEEDQVQKQPQPKSKSQKKNQKQQQQQQKKQDYSEQNQQVNHDLTLLQDQEILSPPSLIYTDICAQESAQLQLQQQEQQSSEIEQIWDGKIDDQYSSSSSSSSPINLQSIEEMNTNQSFQSFSAPVVVQSTFGYQQQPMGLYEDNSTFVIEQPAKRLKRSESLEFVSEFFADDKQKEYEEFECGSVIDENDIDAMINSTRLITDDDYFF